MFKILVDTSAWWHWFALLDGNQFDNTRNKVHAEFFQQLYSLCLANKERMTFLHNQRVFEEIGKYQKQFEIKALPYSRKIPIPLSRADGAYRFDGSLLCGGRMGGSLRELLNLSGYQHEKRLSEAANNFSGGKAFYELKARSREFDIEHMESALEADADYFVTADEKTILKPLRQVQKDFVDSHAISRIISICLSPEEAYRALIKAWL